MWNFIKSLFHICDHKWKFLEEHRIVKTMGDDKPCEVYLGKIYECEHCGKLKKETVYLW